MPSSDVHLMYNLCTLQCTFDLQRCMYNVHLWHINCAFYALAEVPYNVVPKVHFFENFCPFECTLYMTMSSTQCTFNAHSMFAQFAFNVHSHAH